MPVSTRHNHHLVASYRNPPIRVFAAPPWMLSRTFQFTRKCGCTMARSIITPDQDGKKITVRIKLPADPCKRCLGRCLEAGARPPVLTRVGQEHEGVRAPAARPAAPRAQRSEKGLIPIEFPRIEKRFSRISVASRLYPAKAPGGGPRSVVTRAACRAHPSSRHTRKRCFASRTRRIALKRRNIKHSAGG